VGWDPGIIFRFNLVQLMEHEVVMALLEDKKSLGREDCNVLIFGFPIFTVGGNLMGLCHLGQRGKWRLKVGSGKLEELYEAQPSPFTLFHHHDHFCIVRS
jgi:hypothetical protein